MFAVFFKEPVVGVPYFRLGPLPYWDMGKASSAKKIARAERAGEQGAIGREVRRDSQRDDGDVGRDAAFERFPGAAAGARAEDAARPRREHCVVVGEIGR